MLLVVGLHFVEENRFSSTREKNKLQDKVVMYIEAR